MLDHYMALFARGTGRDIELHSTERVTLSIYRCGQSLTAFQLEAAMSTQNAIGRQVARAIAPYDVLLTPALVRDVAKSGEIDPHAADVDMRA